MTFRPKNGFRAVIFDMDGLIVDTETPEYLSWKEIYEAHGVPLPMTFWSRLIGTQQVRVDLAARLVEESRKPLDLEEVHERRRTRYQEIRQAYMKPMTGFLDLTDALKDRGIPRALASASSRRWVDFILDELRVRDRFEAIVTGDDVPRGKPDPDCYLLAAVRLGVPPGNAWRWRTPSTA
jgi:HAD superfamily hydrolase (TIGR01509 family)